MRLYNTLTRQKEPFAPAVGNQVRLYACGLTVYARGHIGNFRTFLCLDVLRRTLKYVAGYDVRQVVNFTDVDDKTIAGAEREGRAARGVHRALHPGLPRRLRHARPRAGRGEPARHRPGQHPGDGRHDRGARGQGPHLPQRRLDLLQDRDDARLRPAGPARPRRDPEPARASTPTSTRRRTPATSCCGRRPSRASRPGTPASARAGPAGTSSARRWRCGCWAGRRSTSTPAASTWSSRTTRTRSRRASAPPAQPFARFWVHFEHLLVENQKMSKSLGNVFTISDVIERGLPGLDAALPAALRPPSHAAQLHLGGDGAGRGGAAPADRLPGPARRRWRKGAGGAPNAELAARVAQGREDFDAAMRDDLNTAAALGAMFELVRAMNAAIDAGRARRRRRAGGAATPSGTSTT